MFTRTARTAAALIIIVALAGCSAQTVTAGATATATKTKPASPTPTPTPTPKVMTVPEAAELYKTTACSVNLPLRDFNNVLQSGSGDIDALHSTAAVARDASSAAGTKLDQALWPEDLKADASAVRDGDFSQAATLTQMVAAPTWEAAMQIAFESNDAAAAASQRLRSRLGLPADPFAC